MSLHLFSGLEGEILSGVAKLTAGALVAGLWQGILLCAAAGLTLKLVPKTTARMRFVVWIAVFGVSVAMPFVSLHEAVLAGQGSPVSERHLMFDLRWSYLLAAGWVIAVACRLIALVRQGIGLHLLWKSAVPVADERLVGLNEPPAGRKVEICTSEEVDRPSVIGFFAPRILIPASLLDTLTAIDLKHIVLHEMEHLRRRDDWLNLVQKIGLVILPLNPALFWIDRRLSAERELACDDGVLEQTMAPKAYAASLTSIAERRLGLRSNRRIAALALGATGAVRRRPEFSRRIESILGRRPAMSPAIASGLAAVLVAAIVGSAAGLAHAPQLVSFGPSAGASAQQVTASVSGEPFVKRSEMLVRQTVAATSDRSAASFENASFHVPAKAGAPSGSLQAGSLEAGRGWENATEAAVVAGIRRTAGIRRCVCCEQSRYDKDQATVRSADFVQEDGRGNADFASAVRDSRWPTFSGPHLSSCRCAYPGRLANRSTVTNPISLEE